VFTFVATLLTCPRPCSVGLQGASSRATDPLKLTPHARGPLLHVDLNMSRKSLNAATECCQAYSDVNQGACVACVLHPQAIPASYLHTVHQPSYYASPLPQTPEASPDTTQCPATSKPNFFLQALAVKIQKVHGTKKCRDSIL